MGVELRITASHSIWEAQFGLSKNRKCKRDRAGDHTGEEDLHNATSDSFHLPPVGEVMGCNNHVILRADRPTIFFFLLTCTISSAPRREREPFLMLEIREVPRKSWRKSVLLVMTSTLFSYTFIVYASYSCCTKLL